MMPQSAAAPQPLHARVPAWAEEAIADGQLRMFSAVVPSAAAMTAETLRARVGTAYRDLGRAIRAAGQSPIRLWNYMPDPGADMGAGLNRYMVFNAGRYDGYQHWWDPTEARSLPTASGVGIGGDDLTVHCLASRDDGIAVENPRQRPAWRYSARYGPRPPCFARATIARLDGRPRLLIGGTASIVGEDSCHERDTRAQLEETLANLSALIDAAGNGPDGAALSRLTDVRVYLVDAADASLVESVLRARRAGLQRLEMRTARLCRPELLVEIEGVAELQA